MSHGRVPSSRTVHRWGREELISSIKIALFIAVFQQLVWVISTYSLDTYTTIPINQWGQFLLTFVSIIPAATVPIVLMQYYRLHGIIGVVIYTVIAAAASLGLGSLSMALYIIIGTGAMTVGMLVILFVEEVGRAVRI